MTTMNGTSGFQDFEFLWKRPEVPPRLWSVFEGRRRLEDGTLLNFIIQEMPEEMMEEVLDHMMNYCFTEEIASVNIGLPKDPLGMQELRSFLKCWILQGVSIVTLLVNTDPSIKPKLVGANVLCVSTAQDDVTIMNCIGKFKSKIAKKMMTVELDFTREVNIFEIYGVDKYLGCFGLSVLPSFRGFGLGEKMLRARESIGRAYKIPISATHFTGATSQALAYRTDFQVLIERKYSELLDRQGNIAYPGIPAEYIYYMAKRLY